MENRIKDAQLELFADRTSSHTFRANQLRLWFASFAYVQAEKLVAFSCKGRAFARAAAASNTNGHPSRLLNAPPLLGCRRRIPEPQSDPMNAHSYRLGTSPRFPSRRLVRHLPWARGNCASHVARGRQRTTLDNIERFEP
jgi:hypothetical protein